jgi:hypothetical protein
MTSLFSPDHLHVLFAVAGALFGYWLKRHPDVVPPDLQPILDLLLQRHQAAQQADAHDRLQALSSSITEPKGK